MTAAPDWSAAVVPETKLTAYLLNPEHPEGGSKALALLRLGFRREAAAELADALRRHAAEGEAAVLTTEHGTKHVVTGPLRGPSGRERRVVAVWIVEPGRTAPRLVTAHPTEAAA